MSVSLACTPCIPTVYIFGGEREMASNNVAAIQCVILQTSRAFHFGSCDFSHLFQSFFELDECRYKVTMHIFYVLCSSSLVGIGMTTKVRMLYITERVWDTLPGTDVSVSC